MLNDVIACGVPDIDAEGEVGLGLHGQVRLDSSWPAGILAYVLASRVSFRKTDRSKKTINVRS
jgi:hypothetical protein